MLSSAAKLGIILLSGWLQGGLSGREAADWRRIEPSLAYVEAEDKPIAVCVLIDDSGLFVGVDEGIKGDIVEAIAGDKHFTLKRLGSDSATGLVLLQATPWAYGQGRVAYLTDRPVSQHQELIVALPSGPIRAEFVSSNRVGVLNTSKRMFPLNELRFEAPDGSVAGGIVFNKSGELIGAVTATLQAQANQSQTQARGAASPVIPQGFAQSQSQGLGGGGGASLGGVMQPKVIGPNDAITAYTVGLGVMRRVVEGFKSPSHEVQHPSIGIFCKDSPQIAGALVTRMRQDGAAAKAGMQVGDIILSIDGQKIKNQIGFASEMLKKEIGQTLVVWVLRNSLQVRLSIPVGKA